MNNVSDKHIINLLISPENREQGFSLLLDTYQERLYWHIRRIVIEHEDANDVIQNTMIKVFRNIDRFKGESKLYTWMYRIATNEAITFMNKKNKHKSISVDDQEIALNKLASDPYFEGDEIERKLLVAVKTLPEFHSPTATTIMPTWRSSNPMISPISLKITVSAVTWTAMDSWPGSPFRKIICSSC